MAGVLKKSYISRGVTWQKICEQDWSDYFIVEVNLFGKKSLNWGKKWTYIWCLEGGSSLEINIKISQFHGKLVLFMPKICVYFFSPVSIAIWHVFTKYLLLHYSSIFNTNWFHETMYIKLTYISFEKKNKHINFYISSLIYHEINFL